MDTVLDTASSDECVRLLKVFLFFIVIPISIIIITFAIHCINIEQSRLDRELRSKVTVLNVE